MISGIVYKFIEVKNTKLKMCILFQQSCAICTETDYSVPSGCKVLFLWCLL